jgi:hypothetical protein
MISLAELTVIIFLSFPAGVVSAVLSDYLVDHELDLTLSMSRMVLRIVIFWAVFVFLGLLLQSLGIISIVELPF